MMKCRMNPPSNDGNNQPDNPIQDMTQGYPVNPCCEAMPMPPVPQNFNQWGEQQDNFNDCQSDNVGQQYSYQQNGDEQTVPQVNNFHQTPWQDNRFCPQDYPNNNNFSNGSDFPTHPFDMGAMHPDAFSAPPVQQSANTWGFPSNAPATPTCSLPQRVPTYGSYVPPRKKAGQIYNRRRARQIFDYSGINCDGCTPTDVDGVLDIRKKGFIIIEMKCLPLEIKRQIREGKIFPPDRLPPSQKFYLERDVNAKQLGGFPTALFLADHDVFDPEEDVNAAEAIVLAVFYHNWWYIPKYRHTLKECVHHFWYAVMNGYGDQQDYYYGNCF